MRVHGLSDLHVGHPANRETLQQLAQFPADWLIAAGDIGESEDHLRFAWDQLVPRFSRVVWVPGNHELWSTGTPAVGGVEKYERLVALCREYGVLTPEDPYPELEPGLFLAPLFLLYDYSYAPIGMTPAEAVRWAAESGIVCADEHRLSPAPYASRQDWCRARLDGAVLRLEALPPGSRTILVNHWPLRLDLCRLFRIPRFTPWCGTRETEQWHLRFRAELVVSGHLHMRATDWRDGVRFEEVSLGYPRQYDAARGAPGYLRQIWPATEPAPAGGGGGPIWHR
jgi:3',5'-cyclic AMP phosphodiesterase CpdA